MVEIDYAALRNFSPRTSDRFHVRPKRQRTVPGALTPCTVLESSSEEKELSSSDLHA
jgi:hypothetical protein